MIRDDMKKIVRDIAELKEANRILTGKLIGFGWALDVLAKKGYIEKGEIEAYGKERIKESAKQREKAEK